MSKPLTPKQEAFVLAYVKTGNASEAYRQVYDTNASAKTINEKASRLLAEGKVRARFGIMTRCVTGLSPSGGLGICHLHLLM